nr:MAG TPA_asm: hypothetical protein [Caudoviricetes sp.]
MEIEHCLNRHRQMKPKRRLNSFLWGCFLSSWCTPFGNQCRYLVQRLMQAHRKRLRI